MHSWGGTGEGLVAMRDRAALSVGVLGPLEVTLAGRPVEVTAGRLRTLLAALAMSAGTTISVDRLVAAVWDEDLPDDARRSLYTYVNRLRGSLGSELISTKPAGYLLHAGPEQVDALRFELLVEAAAQAPDPGTERALLTTALSLWRGTPFEDIGSTWLKDSESPRLLERYLGALERRIDLDLAGGRHEELVAQLRELTARYPLRESLWVRLLIALQKCGRTAEALRRYEMIRRHLADELGADPSPQLREVYADLLRAGEDDRSTVPRQLPADVDAFTGRDAELTTLDKLLGSAGRLVTIAGTAGVGKTALAVHWAHRVADRFPDGQFYADLRGFGPGGQVVRPATVLRGFLNVLGVRPPNTMEEQVGLYRSLMAGRRVLVVLDNARDAEQVRPLLPGGADCVVVVTSRDQLSGLVAAEGAHPVVLDLFDPTEAQEMMSRRLGAERAAAEPDCLRDIVERCARLPLALAIVAARAATYPKFSLSALADQLRAAQQGLDPFANGDPATDVRAVFSWSYRTLSPGAARLFRLIGLHPGPDLAPAAAASLVGLPVPDARPLLAELARAHLISEHLPGRYTLHDLLRTYAGELAREVDAFEQRQEAVGRLLDHYLSTAHTAALLIYPRDPITPLPARAGVTPVELADHGQAMAWFTAEHQVLLAIVDLATGAGFDTHTWQLAWSLYSFFDWRGHWTDQAATQRAALDATVRLGDQPGQARAHVNLAQANMRLRHYDEAHCHLRQALDQYTGLGDRTGQARTHLNLCQVFAWQDNHQRALEHGLLALDLHRATDHEAGQADALNEVGWCHAMLGEYQQTIAYCEEALPLLEKLGHRHGQAATWDSLGYAHHHLGEWDRATACYRQALDTYQELGDRYRRAETLTRLGDTYQAAGDCAAGDAWREALEIFADLGHAEADRVRERLMGGELPIAH